VSTLSRHKVRLNKRKKQARMIKESSLSGVSPATTRKKKCLRTALANSTTCVVTALANADDVSFSEKREQSRLELTCWAGGALYWSNADMIPI
jgi:hypothetical protein